MNNQNQDTIISLLLLLSAVVVILKYVFALKTTNKPWLRARYLTYTRWILCMDMAENGLIFDFIIRMFENVRGVCMREWVLVRRSVFTGHTMLDTNERRYCGGTSRLYNFQLKLYGFDR